jgi:hypothetical protein
VLACNPVSLGGNGSGGAPGSTTATGATTGGTTTGGATTGGAGTGGATTGSTTATGATTGGATTGGAGTGGGDAGPCAVDCTTSPLAECNSMACDPSTGQCIATPDCAKEGAPCALTGDPCSVGKTCSAGQCAGGVPKDCSALGVGCQVGTCDGMTGDCVASMVPDGSACNDRDACTQGDTCMAGVCAGTAVAGCAVYFTEGFETCPDGWTLGGDWQCGTPTSTSPVTPHTGHGVIATQLDGLYHVDQSYSTCTADSPAIDLTHATRPQLSFWVWDHTEGGTFDGWNLKVSTNGGQTYTEVMTVSPPYPLTIAGQPAWGGDLSALGWQNYTADLTAYAGTSIELRFAFRSDAATVYPGVYIDDVVVAEPPQTPLYVTTPSIPDTHAGTPYATPLARTGGDAGARWSITGGTNDAWLSIDPTTGLLTGTPSQAETGPVSVTVHLAEQALPSNHDDVTYHFDVRPDVYFTSFEGPCPDGWTLTGDWTCGVPMNVGPATAYDGTQCIGTGMGHDYSNLDTWAGTTATSPSIVLPAGCGGPTLTFRMWIDTEGATYDGANLEISTDGGMTYSVLSTVTPPYTLTIGGEPAWGGHQAALGWQLVQADLSAYAGKTIQLRFAFQSDSSDTFAGVYIDDLLIE